MCILRRVLERNKYRMLKAFFVVWFIIKAYHSKDGLSNNRKQGIARGPPAMHAEKRKECSL